MTRTSNAADSVVPAATAAKSPLRSPSVGAAIGSMHTNDAPFGEKTCMNG